MKIANLQVLPRLTLLQNIRQFWCAKKPLQALTNSKVSEKNNERFSRNRVTTNERDSLGLFSAKRRDTIKSFEHFYPAYKP